MTDEMIEKNKELCARYPYLIPRNVWTDKISDNYDYRYIRGESELPDGWRDLFMQMCEDIRQPLIDNNYLEEFRFSQIKEKYGTMRCYNFGAPKEVAEIIRKYEVLSQYVCEDCGRPANYRTDGWIGSYCKDCITRVIKPEYLDSLEKISIDKVINKYEKEWKRLYEKDQNC